VKGLHVAWTMALAGMVAVAAVACQQRGAVAAFVGGSAENAAERIALDKGNRAGVADSKCRTIYSSN
jgi:hypothetical protein